MGWGLLRLVGGQVLGALLKALFDRFWPAKAPAAVITQASAETVMAPVTVTKAVAAIEEKGLG